MSDPLAALAVAAGLLVRLVVPVVITVLAIWLLRRLDARWQAEGTPPPPAASTADGLRCWQVNGCAPETRAVCAAYLDPAKVCWQIFRDRDGNLRQSCLVCDFFRLVPPPASPPVAAHATAHS